MTFSRLVVLGDSTAEGLDDPDGTGGYRGWADRLATAVATAQSPLPLRYANLAVRGKRCTDVRDDQLSAALALDPDLAVVVAGTNDVLRLGSDVTDAVAALEQAFAALTAGGATVLTFTMPDPAPVMPVARLLRGRFAALNEGIVAAARRTGVRVLRLDQHPVASDPRLWSDDRLHANSDGHARIASGLAELLGLPAGSGASWTDPLAGRDRRPPHALLAAEMSWLRKHFAPYVARHLRGRSTGDDRTCKRPELTVVTPPPVAAASEV